MMNAYRSRREATLERIRRARGAVACREAFRALARDNARETARLLGDGRLKFGTLFVLRPEIAEFLPEEELSFRDRTALLFCGGAERACKTAVDGEHPRFTAGESERPVLLWIFTTGTEDDGLCGEFDRVLDLAAAVLIRTYREESILPAAAKLIFRRHRRGAYLHDLIWAYFKARGTDALRIIAGYLRSPVRSDAELARSLLHLTESGASEGGGKQYGEYLSWLRENGPYLYFTGESYQLTNAPSPCGVDLGAKFLCREISHRNRKPLAPLTREEQESLNSFNGAGDAEKETLARYSGKLHEKNPARWNKWMRYPVSRQIEIAGYGRRELV